MIWILFLGCVSEKFWLVVEFDSVLDFSVLLLLDEFDWKVWFFFFLGVWKWFVFVGGLNSCFFWDWEIIGGFVFFDGVWNFKKIVFIIVFMLWKFLLFIGFKNIG